MRLTAFSMVLLSCGGASQADVDELRRQLNEVRAACPTSAPLASNSPVAPVPTPATASAALQTPPPPVASGAITPALHPPSPAPIDRPAFRLRATVLRACSDGVSANGEVWVGVEVLFENKSSDDLALVAGSSAWLEDEAGRRYDARAIGGEEPGGKNRCQPGLDHHYDSWRSVKPAAQYRGYVRTFPVPKTARALKLHLVVAKRDEYERAHRVTPRWDEPVVDVGDLSAFLVVQ